jgi:16S rRNA (uracil1498-N3)-methyltransferase
LRLRAGEAITLTDGRGVRAEGVVGSVAGEELVVALGELSRVPASSPRLTVVQGIPKGERGELAVAMMTEVGVDAIVPWRASRCVTQWREQRGAKALLKWRQSAFAAAKQARRSWFPEVTAALDTPSVARLLAGATGLVLHEEASAPLARVAGLAEAEHVVLVVGPEGGIAPEELAAFAEADARAVLLGDSVLRASTAGVVAASLVLGASGRWG